METQQKNFQNMFQIHAHKITMFFELQVDKQNGKDFQKEKFLKFPSNLRTL